jgi:hypothetical protein
MDLVPVRTVKCQRALLSGRSCRRAIPLLLAALAGWGTLKASLPAGGGAERAKGAGRGHPSSSAAATRAQSAANQALLNTTSRDL